MSKNGKKRFSKLLSVIMVLCMLAGIVSCLCGCDSNSGSDNDYDYGYSESDVNLSGDSVDVDNGNGYDEENSDAYNGSDNGDSSNGNGSSDEKSSSNNNSSSDDKGSSNNNGSSGDNGSSNNNSYNTAEAEKFVNKLFGNRVDISKFMSSPVSVETYHLLMPYLDFDRAAQNIGLGELYTDVLNGYGTASDKTYKDYLADDEIAQFEKEFGEGKISWATYVYNLDDIQAFVDSVWEPGRYNMQNIDKIGDYSYTSKAGYGFWFNEGMGDHPFWMNKVTNVTPDGNGYKAEVSGIEINPFTDDYLSEDSDFDDYSAAGFDVDARYIVNLVNTGSGLRVDSIQKV